VSLAAIEFVVCLLVPLGIAAVIAIAVASHRAAVARREAFRALAERLGLRFDGGSDARFDDRHPQFECFRRGHSRRAFNLLSGPLPGGTDAAFGCVAGEYEFKETQGSGKYRRTVTYRFGFVVVETPWRAMPDLIVRREGIMDRIAGVMGFGDIDFESAEFSRRFHVKTPDRRFAYDLIDPRMMEFLLVGEPPSIDIGGHAVCLWFGQNARLDPAGIEALLRWAREFIDRWPRVLVSRLDEGGRSPRHA
jgi:hypothetical protein